MILSQFRLLGFLSELGLVVSIVLIVFIWCRVRVGASIVLVVLIWFRVRVGVVARLIVRVRVWGGARFGACCLFLLWPYPKKGLTKLAYILTINSSILFFWPDCHLFEF